ncbi:hypothetical protein JAAARDRAFT_41016 [Jaapia argillacea MUCL 33604]|uniref:Uncharacterized protein n=1 Tax=Jaapia argillacea MUCL 33604 TaxID=933084 RepID=A0A067PML4_9AGAM|nr:hypothetical protein JAAARDRAFT_41016 [Jaapia argillacea MUCL 33604]
MIFSKAICWVSQVTKSIAKSAIPLIQEFVDVDKYSGLRSPSDQALISTLDNVACHRNTILACLFALLSAQITLMKCGVWMLTSGLILITLALKSRFEHASIETLRTRVETLGVPAFATLTTLPSFGLFIAITLEYFQVTPPPRAVSGFVLAILIPIYGAGLFVGIWERFFVKPVVVPLRGVFVGKNEMVENL